MNSPEKIKEFLKTIPQKESYTIEEVFSIRKSLKEFCILHDISYDWAFKYADEVLKEDLRYPKEYLC